MTVELSRESVRLDALDRLGHAKHHCRDGRSARRLSGSGFEVSQNATTRETGLVRDLLEWLARSPATTSTAGLPRPARSRNLSQAEGVKRA